MIFPLRLRRDCQMSEWSLSLPPLLSVRSMTLPRSRSLLTGCFHELGLADPWASSLSCCELSLCRFDVLCTALTCCSLPLRNGTITPIIPILLWVFLFPFVASRLGKSVLCCSAVLRPPGGGVRVLTPTASPLLLSPVYPSPPWLQP